MKIILPCLATSSKLCLPFRIPKQNLVHISLFAYVCLKLSSSHLPWCYCPNNIWWGVKIMNFFIMKLSASFYHLPLSLPVSITSCQLYPSILPVSVPPASYIPVSLPVSITSCQLYPSTSASFCPPCQLYPSISASFYHLLPVISQYLCQFLSPPASYIPVSLPVSITSCQLYPSISASTL